MNDNTLRGQQWQRLLGEFYAPILGGTPERWGEANRIVSARLWGDGSSLPVSDQFDAAYEEFDRAFQLAWLRDMCEEAGVPAPAEAVCLDLVRRADAYVTRRVQAAYPGAVDAIRALHEEGYHLHTASGESSTELDGYLTGMGVRHCFDRLYGADLVRALKTGPTYYSRVFSDAAVNPADALVVDDKPSVLAWAAQLGARTALVGTTNGDFVPELRVASLADLPEAIDALTTVR
jgi:HAD superfamily hydrolase (TIGR01509 family)